MRKIFAVLIMSLVCVVCVFSVDAFAATRDTYPYQHLLVASSAGATENRTAANDTEQKKGWWGNFWENNKLWDNKEVAKGISEWWNDEDFWENNKDALIAVGVGAAAVAAAVIYFNATGEAPDADYFEWLKGSDEIDTPENWEWYNTPDDKRWQWLQDHPDF